MSKEIIYAGSSQRRTECLAQIPGHAVTAIGGGPEPNTPFVRQVVMAKLIHADSIISGHNPQRETLVAADTRTELRLTRRSWTFFESRGKPNTLDEVRQNLLRLANRPTPTYRVVSGSGCHNGKLHTSVMACTIELDPTILTHLATPNGFREYTAAFDQFYSQPPYSTTGMAALTPCDSSAGLSLPVFIQLGAVTAIDGIPWPQIKTARDPLQLLSTAMLTVAVGLSPDILDQISPAALPAIMKWGWLQQVTRHLI